MHGFPSEIYLSIPWTFFGEDDVIWNVINTAAAGQSFFDRHPGACKAWAILLLFLYKLFLQAYEDIIFIYPYIWMFFFKYIYISCTCQALPKPSSRGRPSTVEGLGMVTPSPVRAAPSPSSASAEPINLEDNDLISWPWNHTESISQIFTNTDRACRTPSQGILYWMNPKPLRSQVALVKMMRQVHIIKMKS